MTIAELQLMTEHFLSVVIAYGSLAFFASLLKFSSRH